MRPWPAYSVQSTFKFCKKNLPNNPHSGYLNSVLSKNLKNRDYKIPKYPEKSVLVSKTHEKVDEYIAQILFLESNTLYIHMKV